MVEVCAYAQLQQILGFARFFSIRGSGSSGEFEQICNVPSFEKYETKVHNILQTGKDFGEKVTK